MEQVIDIVFDGPPEHDGPRLVEVESPPGRSICLGEWVQREDGYWALRFKATLPAPPLRRTVCGELEDMA
jgi:hypothetical protein